MNAAELKAIVRRICTGFEHTNLRTFGGSCAPGQCRAFRLAL